MLEVEKFVLCIMETRQEFVEETFSSFVGEFVEQSPHTTFEDGEHIIHVLTRWHPIQLIRFVHGMNHNATAPKSPIW
jgi:hypothetical protein